MLFKKLAKEKDQTLYTYVRTETETDRQPERKRYTVKK